MIHELQRESMNIDNPRRNEGSPCRPKENGVHLYPVSVNDSGEGLPYAPEDWPNPGDKWVWKVGRRINVSGFFMDRYLYLPSRFRQAGQGRSFASKLSLKQYVRNHFPEVDVDAFLSSFSWKIPSKAFKRDNKEIFRNHGETSEHPVSDSPMGGCKAGNRFCSSLDTGEDSVLEIMFCDICCSEPSFCRDCCCILCSRTINKALGYSYIRCEATINGYICGHNCHIDCALRAYMAGTVGGSIGLESEYYCCRCDSRTDLVSHVTKLLRTCESIDSRDDIEKILNVGICVLRGSKKTNAHQLLNSIDKAMLKLKNGAYIEDIWKNEDAFAVADDENAGKTVEHFAVKIESYEAILNKGKSVEQAAGQQSVEVDMNIEVNTSKSKEIMASSSAAHDSTIPEEEDDDFFFNHINARLTEISSSISQLKTGQSLNADAFESLHDRIIKGVSDLSKNVDCLFTSLQTLKTTSASTCQLTSSFDILSAKVDSMETNLSTRLDFLSAEISTVVHILQRYVAAPDGVGQKGGKQ